MQRADDNRDSEFGIGSGIGIGFGHGFHCSRVDIYNIATIEGLEGRGSICIDAGQRIGPKLTQKLEKGIERWRRK